MVRDTIPNSEKIVLIKAVRLHTLVGFKLIKSRNCAAVDWNPKCSCICCQTSASDVECFTIEFREITGQKFAICPSIRSSCTHFCMAVRLAAAGTSLISSTNSLFVDLSTHVVTS